MNPEKTDKNSTAKVSFLHENEFLWKFNLIASNGPLTEERTRELFYCAREYYCEKINKRQKDYLDMIYIIEKNCASKKQKKILKSHREAYDKPFSENIKDLQKSIKRKNSDSTESKRRQFKKRDSVSKLVSLLLPKKMEDTESGNTETNRGNSDNIEKRRKQFKRRDSISRLTSLLSSQKMEEEKNGEKDEEKKSSNIEIKRLNLKRKNSFSKLTSLLSPRKTEEDKEGDREHESTEIKRLNLKRKNSFSRLTSLISPRKLKESSSADTKKQYFKKRNSLSGLTGMLSPRTRNSNDPQPSEMTPRRRSVSHAILIKT